MKRSVGQLVVGLVSLMGAAFLVGVLLNLTYIGAALLAIAVLLAVGGVLFVKEGMVWK